MKQLTGMLCLVLLAATVVGCPSGTDQVDPSLLGTWDGTATTVIPSGTYHNAASFTFTGSAFASWEGAGTIEGTYSVDTSSSPRALDLHITHVSNSAFQVLVGKTCLGRYGFVEGELILTYNAYGKPRPSGISNGNTVFISGAKGLDEDSKGDDALALTAGMFLGDDGER